MIKDLEAAHRVLDIEAKALIQIKNKLNGAFVKALDMMQACEGKVIITGIGKSGQVGRKISSTLSSTGTPSVFLHPAESSHGDLGVVGSKDVLIAISYGGETPELQDVVRYCARKGIPLIVMTGKSTSTLAKASDCVLDISVEEEACPMGLAPTASSTATMALGDALAVALLNRRGFKEEDFAEYHPGGTLGRRLLTRVEDVMHKGDALLLVDEDAPMREVITKMTHREVRGVAGVVDKNNNLIGVIVDGDIRRRLEKSQDPLADRAQDIMSRSPKTIDVAELAEKAAFVMEQFSIQILFVLNRASMTPNKPVGILNFQDLLKAKLR